MYSEACPFTDESDRGRLARQHTHLFSYICLKVLIRRHVHAHAPILERRRWDFICRTRHSGHYDVREGKAPREVEFRRGGTHHVMWVIRASLLRGRWTFGIFLYRVNVDGKNVRAVVGQERREWAAYHFRSFITQGRDQRKCRGREGMRFTG